MESFLFQASIYLAAAVIAVPLAIRFQLGSVLGYLIAGIFIGPVFAIVGQETQSLQHFAEFGVAMMLFLIGLELEPRTLWNMRHRLVGLGGLQLGLTTAALTAIAIHFGFPWQQALAIGLTFSLSSTAIVLQTLGEKKLMQTNGGRASLSVLLTQDISVIPILALLPLLAISSTIGAPETQHSAAEHSQGFEAVEPLQNWIESLSPLGTTAVTVAVILVTILAGIYLLRPAFNFIHSARLPEMYTAFSLLIVVGIGAAMVLVGLSPALGTFLAGMILANSEFRHQLESDIAPFKGLLLGLFFITVGAGINFALLAANPLKILAYTGILLGTKFAVLMFIALLFRIRGRDRWLFSLGLAQAGEFGFVLTAFSRQQGILSTETSGTLLVVIAASMMASPLLFLLYEFISDRISEDSNQHTPADEIQTQHPIIIAGIGRFGQVVTRLVQSAGFQTTILDSDLTTVQAMRKFGFKGFFGDPTRPEILNAAGLSTARVLVVALDDPAATLRLVTYARNQRPDLHIIVRARDRGQVYRLYAAGADDIVRELFDSSLRAGRYVLEQVGLTEYEAAEAEQMYYKHDRKAIRELAKLYDPNIPVDENTAYMERSRELEKELEVTLLAQSRASNN